MTALTRPRPAQPKAPRRAILDFRSARLGVQIGVVAVLIVAWDVYSKHISPILIPSPSAVWSAFLAMVRSGEIFQATGESMKEFGVGFGLAIVAGVPIGMLFGRARPFTVATEHIFNALYATPQIAFLPLMIVWFGLGFEAKVAIVFLVSFFPIMFNTADGVRQVSRHHVEVARGYGANERQLLREVMLPSILPQLMTGLRLGAGRGLEGMIVAEMFTALNGLGGIIISAGNTLQTAKLFVPIFVLGFIAMLVIQFGRMLENRLVRWKNTERAFD